MNRAIGVLAVRRGVSTTDAEALLRADAYARGSSSADAARRVLGVDAGSS
ncbi:MULTISPECIES: ANTAR domain-containing protein [Nocardiaceae]|uniref:ANTAR domain-containing protein n=1 Tax=Rhodococcoides kroppenstedtii TaxID=293050 RepID=A0ABS7NQ68_9NOCA|nr:MULTISPECIES: ANTAR domain-containing protein [Rhodococcus]MBY6312316.1 ANTAR domain-containing protein [Rhodococcus kroppenstedtii]MBY6319600.1 ANTAR domain-containing protein [Rhodococcus kroppenstedtii]MBY6398283.1 ANTAR domain-containing protein [Rhodococcus kroppenstedtii]MBY6438608.1 ANTAR domain-containing protein [Rhodococcus kroppenstedtii]